MRRWRTEGGRGEELEIDKGRNERKVGCRRIQMKKGGRNRARFRVEKREIKEWKERKGGRNMEVLVFLLGFLIDKQHGATQDDILQDNRQARHKICIKYHINTT